MKRLLLSLVLIGLCASVSFGEVDFDFTISDVYYNDTLNLNDQSVQVTGAGAQEIIANGASYVEVIDTTPFEYNVGGIRRTELYGTSSANISGGEFDYFGTYDTSILNMTGGSVVDSGFKGSSQITMSGGYISGLFLQENATMNFSNGEIRWFGIYHDATATFSGGSIEIISSRQDSDLTKHITFVADLDSIDLTGNLLTGNWLDGSGFSVTLLDQTGYDPVYSNINVIPEPATVLLFGLGAIGLHRRK